MNRTLSLPLLATVVFACESPEAVRIFETETVAPSLDANDVQNLEHMGTTVVDRGVQFTVYSENATRMELLLFENPEDDFPQRRLKMDRVGDIYSLYVIGVGIGQTYGYAAWGPNWPYEESWAPGLIDGFISDVDKDGHRFNPNKLLIDPYAKAIHREHDWSRGSTASGPGRTDSTWGAGSKAIVLQSEYAWSAAEKDWRELRQADDHPGHNYEDLIIYEVHAKGLSADPASGAEHPGTYRGVGEMAPYLKDLGITAIELMPINEKPLDGGYWGYQSILFFAAEQEYAATNRPEAIQDEFKWMVDQLHQNDIEVIIDVVYNHTGEGGLWREVLEEVDVQLDSVTPQKLNNFDPKEVAGSYTFRGLDNVAYYALSPEDKGFYMNNTGVGNMTRCNYTPMRRLIMDSLRFWVDEMHVDGFRFDLAPILGEKDGIYDGSWPEVESTVLQDIIDDPLLARYKTRMIAEPWSLAGFYLSGFPKATEHQNGSIAWYEWNANSRDVLRSVVNEDKSLSYKEGPIDLGGALTGAYDLFNPSTRRPYHSINFVTAHDGFTLYDLMSYDTKQNGCGPLNPVCCDDPFSPFCDKNSGEDHNRSRNWNYCDCTNMPHCCENLPEHNWEKNKCDVSDDQSLCNAESEALKAQQARNTLALLFLSQGTPMMLGGDEWLRTQLGNNNAYSILADNPANWFQWGTYRASNTRIRMHDYTRQLIQFRKSRRPVFAPRNYDTGPSFAWKSQHNNDDVNWNGRHLMQHFYDAEPELLIIYNLEEGTTNFTLPQGPTWIRRLDTQKYFDSDNYRQEFSLENTQSGNFWNDNSQLISGQSYQAMPHSLIVLEAATP